MYKTGQMVQKVDDALLNYERTVAVAAGEGIDVINKNFFYKWTYIQSIFFASTIITTVGMCLSLLCADDVIFDDLHHQGTAISLRPRLEVGSFASSLPSSAFLLLYQSSRMSVKSQPQWCRPCGPRPSLSSRHSCKSASMSQFLYDQL